MQQDYGINSGLNSEAVRKIAFRIIASGAVVASLIAGVRIFGKPEAQSANVNQATTTPVASPSSQSTAQSNATTITPTAPDTTPVQVDTSTPSASSTQTYMQPMYNTASPSSRAS